MVDKSILSNHNTKSSLNRIVNVANTTTTVCCPNTDTAQWSLHPKIYINFEDNIQVKCYYCSTIYRKSD